MKKKKEEHKKTEKKSTKKESSRDLDKKLTENFVSLQKVMTNLVVKLDDLSTNVSKLLQIFEISAKDFAEKYSGVNLDRVQGESDQEFLKKLDNLLDQNKTISKGIMMMEERLRNRNPHPVRPEHPRTIRRPPR